jgi:Ca2+-binding EF-hand superfamily protein
VQGYFSANELMDVMKAMGGNPSPEEVQAVLYELDANGDHLVDFPE